MHLLKSYILDAPPTTQNRKIKTIETMRNGPYCYLGILLELLPILGSEKCCINDEHFVRVTKLSFTSGYPSQLHTAMYYMYC